MPFENNFHESQLRPLGAANQQTIAFKEAIAQRLAEAPPPWSIEVDLLRSLRARGEGILPIDGPLPELDWVEVPNAPPGGPARARRADPAAAKLVYLHIHGGGWTIGAPEQFDGRNLRLCRAANAIVLSPSYRLGPEHRWPACLDDALAAARMARNLAAELGLPWAIGGESAGAHLAAAALLTLRAEGALGRIAGAVLFYGCFDLRMSPSMRNWGDANLVLSTPVVDWFIRNLLGPDGRESPIAADPIASPILAELGGLCPALFQVGGADPLLDDTLMMAARWAAAGDSARQLVWPEAIHAFDYFDAPEFDLPIALEAQAETAAFLRNCAGAA